MKTIDQEIKLAIVGSRSITDFQILDCFGIGAMSMQGISLFDVSHIISGGAIGVDKLAERLVRKYKSLRIEPVIYKPDYEKYGKNSAPKVRNTVIAERCEAAIVIWDGSSGGAWDTLNKVRLLSKPYILITVRVEDAAGRKSKKQTVKSIDFHGDWKKLYEDKVLDKRSG